MSIAIEDTKAGADAYRKGVEDAAKVADEVSEAKSSLMRLIMGEASAQEIRTARAWGAYIATRIRALPPLHERIVPAQGDEVVVKPLEWAAYDETREYAYTGVGQYLIDKVYGTGKIRVYFRGVSFASNFQNVEAARENAQADFDQRIRSCLATTAEER